MGSHDAFTLIVSCFDDEADLVRNAAVRAILTLEPHRPVEPLTMALKEASPERSARIGKAISASGVAKQVLKDLSNKDLAYNSLCILFAMAKAGEVDPLIDAIENHSDAEIRLAAVRLLKLSGQEKCKCRGKSMAAAKQN
jgi:HEAT repeat protein